jgi:hypothetical protein
MVFPFPIVPGDVLRLIDDIAAGRVTPWQPGAGPASFQAGAGDIAAGLGVLAGADGGEVDGVGAWLQDL